MSNLLEPTIMYIECPPKSTMPRMTHAEIKVAQDWMATLSKAGFKPGEIRSRSTASFTKALTAKYIRTVAKLRGERLTVGDVESYDSRFNRSNDLFGIIDLLVITPERTIGVQACGRDRQQHVEKFCDDIHAKKTALWLEGGCRSLELWSWSQQPGFNKNGTRSKTKFWYPRVQIITLDFMLGHAPPQFTRFWEA